MRDNRFLWNGPFVLTCAIARPIATRSWLFALALAATIAVSVAPLELPNVILSRMAEVKVCRSSARRLFFNVRIVLDFDAFPWLRANRNCMFSSRGAASCADHRSSRP